MYRFNKKRAAKRSGVYGLVIFIAGSCFIVLCAALIPGLHDLGQSLLIAAVLIVGIAQSLWALHLYRKNIQPVKRAKELLESLENETGDIAAEQISWERLGPLGDTIKKLANSVHEKSATKMLSVQASLFALQSQINPHFLYNTLETIRSQALKREVDEIADMAEALATLFRYSISQPNEIATLADEIDNVKNYLMIQQYRFSNRFDVKWVIEDDDENIMLYTLPILTIQPLVENAIQHGLESMLERGLITIRVETTQHSLMISVSDDGSGMTADKLEALRRSLENSWDYFSDVFLRAGKKRHGIALNNVNQRIRLFYGKEYGLELFSTAGVGTTVRISVPKRSGKYLSQTVDQQVEA